MITSPRTFKGGKANCRVCANVITLKTKGHLANNPRPLCGSCYLSEKRELRKLKGER